MHRQSSKRFSVYQRKTPGKEWLCYIYYHNKTTIWATTCHNRNILLSLPLKQFLNDTQQAPKSLKIDTSLGKLGRALTAHNILDVFNIGLGVQKCVRNIVISQQQLCAFTLCFSLRSSVKSPPPLLCFNCIFISF